jgi:hypothetical protein
MGMTKEGWRKRKLNGNGIPWNKGKKGSQIAWNKGKSLEDHPTMGFQKGHRDFLDGEPRKRSVENHKGEKHWNWKGGSTPLVLLIRHCHEYRLWVSDVFTRDSFICQNCGLGGVLEAHHIKRFNEIFYDNDIRSLEEALACSELWNINNGITFCIKCHRKWHNRAEFNKKASRSSKQGILKGIL